MAVKLRQIQYQDIRSVSRRGRKMNVSYVAFAVQLYSLSLNDAEQLESLRAEIETAVRELHPRLSAKGDVEVSLLEVTGRAGTSGSRVSGKSPLDMADDLRNAGFSDAAKIMHALYEMAIDAGHTDMALRLYVSQLLDPNHRS